MNNIEDQLLLYYLSVVIIVIFLVLYLLYIFITLSIFIETLNNILPTIIEHNKELEEAGKLLPK